MRSLNIPQICCLPCVCLSDKSDTWPFFGFCSLGWSYPGQSLISCVRKKAKQLVLHLSELICWLGTRKDYDIDSYYRVLWRKVTDYYIWFFDLPFLHFPKSNSLVFDTITISFWSNCILFWAHRTDWYYYVLNTPLQRVMLFLHIFLDWIQNYYISSCSILLNYSNFQVNLPSIFLIWIK